MADPKTQPDAQPAADTIEANEFEFLLKKEFKPKTDEAKEAVERARRLVSRSFLEVLADLVPDAVPQARSVGGVPEES